MWAVLVVFAAAVVAIGASILVLVYWRELAPLVHAYERLRGLRRD